VTNGLGGSGTSYIDGNKTSEPSVGNGLLPGLPVSLFCSIGLGGLPLLVMFCFLISLEPSGQICTALPGLDGPVCRYLHLLGTITFVHLCALLLNLIIV